MKSFHPLTPHKRQLSVAQLAGLAVGVFVAVVGAGVFGPSLLAQVRAQALLATPAALPPAPLAAVYYPNCRAAHAAGAYSIRRGAPGYRAELDRDNDGRACEPYVGP